MRNSVCLLIVLLSIGQTNCWAAEGGMRIAAPQLAAKDPDFHVQGEYVGEIATPDGGTRKMAAQVVARGDGKFDVYLLEGGLPGDGWKKGDNRVQVGGTRKGDATTIEGDAAAGEIRGNALTITCKGSGGKGTLQRVERKSPTLGKKPPEQAVVLFQDAADAAKFDGGPSHVSDDGNLVNGVTTKDKFGSYKLHLEFRLAWMPQATDQVRSNSGVYLHNCYEVQVLDSFGLEGNKDECGSYYHRKEPDVNMCLAPLVWQTYDIEFTAPVYNEAGQKTKNARLTLLHNGVVIQQDIELPRPSNGPRNEGPAPQPIQLQDHAGRVQYRNIWLVPK